MTRLGALLPALLLVAVGCSHGGDRSVETTPPPADRAEAEPADDEARRAAAPEPRTISTDRAHAGDAGAGTASRRASEGAVEEGKGYLIAGQPAEAERRFERATRIDPSHGVAWYWLGRARLDLGDRRGAIGVLEKAESLLGPYPGWRHRAAALLARIR